MTEPLLVHHKTNLSRDNSEAKTIIYSNNAIAKSFH
jgi:hypothetical protein